MRIFVCVKQVPDTETKIKLKSDNSGIDETGVKWVMNPYDEIAVEQALKMKEAAGAGQVTVLTLGPKTRSADVLRTAMAMGADDGILIDAPDFVDTYTVAKALSEAIKKEGVPADLILSGKLAIDDNAASVSQQLAEFLNLPHATVVSKLEKNGNSYQIEREVEGGAREVYVLNGACVLACNKGLNTPRYASLPGIMKAKKKPLKELSLSDLGIESGSLKIRYKNFQLPADKPAVKMISGDPAAQAAELARLLREEAKLI